MTDQPPDGTPVQIEFSGSPGEWFGIWITNLLLSIVTLGIYSAWAKVRRKKYFYQNTWVAGRNFDYHATGGQILVGRLIVLAGFVAYSVLGAVPALAVILPFALLLVVPYLVSRGLRFNARMSSWSNVRFGFDGTGWRAFLNYLLYPFLAALTLFAALPFASRAIRRYSIGNHRLGAAPFAFSGRIGPFYRAFFAAVLWVVVVLGIIAAVLVPQLAGMTAEEAQSRGVGFGVAGLYGFLFLGLLPARLIYTAFLRNAIFAGMALDGAHRFRSDIRPMRMVWIVLSNAVLGLVSLGILLPWGQIRLARYLAAHTAVLPAGSLDTFAGALEARTSALGDAYTDLEGFDVGLPV